MSKNEIVRTMDQPVDQSSKKLHLHNALIYSLHTDARGDKTNYLEIKVHRADGKTDDESCNGAAAELFSVLKLATERPNANFPSTNEIVVKGWLAAMSDAFHKAKASGDTHLAGKLQEIQAQMLESASLTDKHRGEPYEAFEQFARQR